MEITSVKEVNIRTLSWAIFKATGLNLGGWNNPKGVPQVGSLAWSKSGGLTVTCPDASPPATVAEIEALIATHDAAAPVPEGFPAEPPVVPPPDPAIATAAAAASVVDEIEKAQIDVGQPAWSSAGKAAIRDKMVALVAEMQK